MSISCSTASRASSGLDRGSVARISSSSRSRSSSASAAVDSDATQLQHGLAQAGYLDPADPPEPADLLAWLRKTLAPVVADQPCTFTPAFAAELTSPEMSPSGRYADVISRLRIPADFLSVVRVSIGLTAVLADLRATADWDAIRREYCGAGTARRPRHRIGVCRRVRSVGSGRADQSPGRVACPRRSARRDVVMSFRTACRRGIESAAIPAAVGLMMAGAGTALPSALAAGRSPAALHQTARIALGTTSDIFNNAFTQAPDGNVFYSKGSKIYVVVGDRAPVIALHAGATVLALAANSTDLFVLTGVTVAEYARSNGSFVRSWTLPTPVTPLTSAGLIAAGSSLWAWTDWATDRSGFEYANVDRISTTSPAVHLVDKKAFPGDLAADSSGLFYEDLRGVADISSIAHVTPSGVVHTRPQTNIDAPATLSGGRLDLLSFHNGHPNLDTYSVSTLARLSSAVVSSDDRDIAGTSLGLLVLSQPCSGVICSSATVSQLLTSGLTTGVLSVPDAFKLLAGPGGVVIEDAGGHMYLVRMGS